ncbi:cation/H(+) antiporter 4-like [Silene latifolia]|uniref:cation/H(+) antiporter 4-like n=1 Tax=Silene latifolia TaxID=37657 RepID=UPI003D786654
MENNKMINSEQDMCLVVPPWYPRNHWPVSDFPFMTLQIQLIVVFCVTQTIHRVFFKRFGLPPLLSQLLAGMVLSPTAHIGKHKVLWRGHDLIFPPAAEEVRRCISMLGFGLSLFMTAVKMDFSMVTRSGKRPLMIGLSLIISTGVTTNIATYLYARTYYFDKIKDQKAILHLASTAPLMGLISFPVIGALLGDMKLLNSELGRLALSSGIISDATSIAFKMLSKTVSLSLKKGERNKHEIAKLIGKDIAVLVFLVFVVFVLRCLLKWMIRETPKGSAVKQGYLTIVFALTLIGGLLSHYCGEFVLLGFFVVGAAVPEGPPLGSGIVDKFDLMVTEVLQPFFITTTAMRADVFEVRFKGVFARGINLLLLCTYATKVGVCLLYGLAFNMALPDALALAAIMSSKGFVDVGNFVMFKQSRVSNYFNIFIYFGWQLIEYETFSYLILMTTVASLVVPVSIKVLYNPLRKYAGYEKRCIMRSQNEEPHLRILACVCRPDNVSTITNLVAESNPTMAKPMLVDVLQLLKLTGRAQPIFIDHNIQQRKSCNQFEDFIWAFNSFKQAYSSKALCMNFFTIVSPATAMHEDVCTLALNNLSSLIILPFHRKLDCEGHMEADDYDQRALNKSVLDLAPCSVGILVERGYKKLNHSSSSVSRLSFSSMSCCTKPPLTSVQVEEDIIGHKVGVIFIGGNDDQEAVTYGKRIAGESVKVEVIRVMGLGVDNPLTMLDCWALEGIRGDNNNNNNISYKEITVKDGPEMAKYLWSIVKEYDVMIVGRRKGQGEECIQTTGLQEWSEVEELGTLGDILAQPDLKCQTSVLVIQQQKQWTT